MAFTISMKNQKARATAPMPPPAPDDEAAEGEDESSETCQATMSSEQMKELMEQGSVTLDADDGEKVVITLDENDASSAEQGESETE